MCSVVVEWQTAHLVNNEEMKFFGDNEIVASLEDFDDAKALYEEGKAGQTTKLTKAELRLVKWMTGKKPLSINAIVSDYKKSNEGQYSQEAIRKIIEGTRTGKGLTYKVPGIYERKSACNLLDVSHSSALHLTSPKSLLANKLFQYTME